MEHSALLSDPTVTDTLRSRSGVEAAVGDPAPATAGPEAPVETLSDCAEPALLPQQNGQQRNSRLDQGPVVEGCVWPLVTAAVYQEFWKMEYLYLNFNIQFRSNMQIVYS